MKLESFRVQNFRSVVDSTDIKLSDVTVLIGPNQSGKSSILQGLEKLAFDAEFEEFDLTQLRGVYKKVVDKDLKTQEVPIATGTFKLAESERTELKAVLGEDADVPATLVVTKAFDNWFRFSIGPTPVAFPSRTALEDGAREIERQLTDLGQFSTQQHLTRAPNNQHQQAFTQAIEAARLAVGAGVHPGKIASTEPILSKFADLGNFQFDDQFKKELATRLHVMKGLVSSTFPSNPRDAGLFNFFLKTLPRTAYFKSYDRLEDEATLEELSKPSEQHRTFRNLLKLADVRPGSIANIPSEKQRQAYLQNASGRVTERLRKAWKQEKLQLDLRLSGNRLMVFTQDPLAVGTLLPPSSGSEGFQWWLGFYINFGASTESEFKRAILLLDDPGVFLHPTGHKDLLSLFDSYLANDVTTVYTTQVPFLIPRDKLNRIRLVTKDADANSSVEEKWYKGKDTDVLAPIRAALGVTLGDSLFAGEITILAEGMSDRILIESVLRAIHRLGLRPLVELEKIEVLVGSGASGVLNFSLLLQIQNLPYVILLDNDDAGRVAAREFPDKGIPEERIFLLPTEGGRDADIEDIFPPETYARAFHRIHGGKLNLAEAQVLDKLGKGSGKVSNRAKSLLRESGSRYELDKVSIAYEIAALLDHDDNLASKVVSPLLSLIDRMNGQVAVYRTEPVST